MASPQGPTASVSEGAAAEERAAAADADAGGVHWADPQAEHEGHEERSPQHLPSHDPHGKSVRIEAGGGSGRREQPMYMGPELPPFLGGGT